MKISCKSIGFRLHFKVEPRYLRGTKQNRTAVDGFADRYLTTRPWYHFVFATAKVRMFFESTKLLHQFFLFLLKWMVWMV